MGWGLNKQEKQVAADFTDCPDQRMLIHRLSQIFGEGCGPAGGGESHGWKRMRNASSSPSMWRIAFLSWRERHGGVPLSSGRRGDR